MWLKYRIIRVPFWLLSKTKKYKLKTQGQENVPRVGPFIVVANHQSSEDVVAVALALRPALKNCQMWPWAKIEIGKGKEGFLGKWLYNFFGVIPVNREEKNIEEVIKKSLECLKRGDIVCVFPEGTRRKYKEVGRFEYGVANLARVLPVPILPVAVYRRYKEDSGVNSNNGIQVNIGTSFYLPAKKKKYEVLEKFGENFEETFDKQIDNLRDWAENLSQDKREMKVLRGITNIVFHFLSSHDTDFKRICRMAEEGDIEHIRDKVLQLLPSDWRKVEK